MIRITYSSDRKTGIAILASILFELAILFGILAITRIDNFKSVKNDTNDYFELIDRAEKNPDYLRYADLLFCEETGKSVYECSYEVEGKFKYYVYGLTSKGCENLKKEAEGGYLRVAVDNLVLENCRVAVNMSYTLKTNYWYQHNKNLIIEYSLFSFICFVSSMLLLLNSLGCYFYIEKAAKKPKKNRN